MRYTVDNDLHIHSCLSSCSSDPEQTSWRILEYAKTYGLKTVCLTDHFWDSAVPGASEWYAPQDFEHISKSKPLPQSDEIRFLFGCEADMDKNMQIGLSEERISEFDFIIIPTTHLHMQGFTSYDEDISDVSMRAKTWVKRLDALLAKDLPFEKIGIAHLACKLIAPTREEYLKTLSLIPEDEMRRLFEKAAKLGVGIELNSSDMSFSDEEADVVLRPFRIAKECGCKFYFGSDAHHPAGLDSAPEKFERAVSLLGLTEDDKFVIK